MNSTSISTEKLFNRNFTIILAGQIISLLGNNLLTFALPYYLLQITGSGTIFGTVLAFSAIPLILASPFGGVLADRVSRKHIMVALDFFTFVTVGLLALTLSEKNAVLMVSVMMILLSLIKALYQPSVNASIPAVASGTNLLRANSAVNMVSSVSSLLGPVLGGLLCGFLPVGMILAACSACFFLSAVMELFIRMPFEKRGKKHSALALVKEELKESIGFITKEKPVIFKTIFYAAFINLFLTCFLLVGVPLLVNVTFGLSSELYGYSQSALGVGSLAGGILVSFLSDKIKADKMYLFLMLAGGSILPIGLTLMAGAPVMVSYVIVVSCAGAVMLFGSIFSIIALTHIQQETPAEMLGKVMSLAITVSLCAQPVGQAAYGILFDLAGANVHWVVIAATLCTAVIAWQSRKTYSDVESNKHFFTDMY